MQKGEVDMVNVGVDVLGGRIGSSMSNNVKTKNESKRELLQKQVSKLEKQSNRNLNPTRTASVKRDLNAAKKDLSNHDRSVSVKSVFAGAVGSNAPSKLKDVGIEASKKISE